MRIQAWVIGSLCFGLAAGCATKGHETKKDEDPAEEAAGPTERDETQQTRTAAEDSEAPDGVANRYEKQKFDKNFRVFVTDAPDSSAGLALKGPPDGKGKPDDKGNQGGGGKPDGGGTLEKVLVTFDRVEVHEEDEGWVTIEDYDGDGKTIDLMSSKTGAYSALGGVALDEGHYTQIRLHLKRENEVVVSQAGETRHESMFVPSGAQTGLKIVRDFTVSEFGVTTFKLDFDAESSVHYAPGKGYMLKPTIRILSATNNPCVMHVVDAETGGEVGIEDQITFEIPEDTLDTDVKICLVPGATLPGDDDTETDDDGTDVIIDPIGDGDAIFLTDNNIVPSSGPIKVTVYYTEEERNAMGLAELDVFTREGPDGDWNSEGGHEDPELKAVTAEVEPRKRFQIVWGGYKN